MPTNGVPGCRECGAPLPELGEAKADLATVGIGLEHVMRQRDAWEAVARRHCTRADEAYQRALGDAGRQEARA